MHCGSFRVLIIAANGLSQENWKNLKNEDSCLDNSLAGQSYDVKVLEISLFQMFCDILSLIIQAKTGKFSLKPILPT